MNNLKFITTLFILCLTPSLRAEIKLKTFETDGCTMFVDGPKGQRNLWKHCCVEHDLRYWFGGSSEDMDAADLRLKSCVEKVGGKKWANLMYTGIRAGHYSPIKFKYRWGWAWSVRRKTTPLTQEEVVYVISELRTLNLDDISVDEFIKTNFP